jgi:hypothetical protein
MASSMTLDVVGEAGVDAAGVEPAHTMAEQGRPVDVSRLELGGGGVTAVGHAERPSYPEAAFGEVEPVAYRPADAVIVDPLNPGGVDAAGQDHVLTKPAHLVVGKSGDDGGPQTKAAA